VTEGASAEPPVSLANQAIIADIIMRNTMAALESTQIEWTPEQVQELQGQYQQALDVLKQAVQRDPTLLTSPELAENAEFLKSQLDHPYVKPDAGAPASASVPLGNSPAEGAIPEPVSFGATADGATLQLKALAEQMGYDPDGVVARLPPGDSVAPGVQGVTKFEFGSGQKPVIYVADSVMQGPEPIQRAVLAHEAEHAADYSRLEAEGPDGPNANCVNWKEGQLSPLGKASTEAMGFTAETETLEAEQQRLIQAAGANPADPSSWPPEAQQLTPNILSARAFAETWARVADNLRALGPDAPQSLEGFEPNAYK
jgi:hypothetical protein